MKLTLIYAMLGLTKLDQTYQRPKTAAEDDEAFAAPFAEVCRNLTVEEFNAAITAYLASPARYYPRPGELLSLALRARSGGQGAGPDRSWMGSSELARGHAQWVRDGEVGPCPVCGSVAAPTHEGGRVMVLHDDQRHREAHVGYAGRSTADHARAMRPPIVVPTGAAPPAAA